MPPIASPKLNGPSGVSARAQRVHYLKDASGASLAWSAVGTGGPALLAMAGWLSHLELDWGVSDMGTFHRAVAARRRLIRYDRPGLGLAERRLADYSLAGAIEHARGVLDASGEERVAVLGRTFSGPAAIALAVAHPARVSHLLLFGTASRIVARPDHPGGVCSQLAEAVERLVLAEWGLGSKTITALMLPDVTSQEAGRYAEYQRQCASPEVVAALIRALASMDVTELLPKVSVPTLVLHRRGDQLLPLECARRLVEAIPGAELRILEGSENLPYFGNRERIVAEFDTFLGAPWASLTRRELEVLDGLAARLANQQIAGALGIAETTVARHVANIFSKLRVGDRTTAVAVARRTSLL